MIRLTVMYPNLKDSKFDLEYYEKKHLPMVTELLGDAAENIDFVAGLGSAVPNEPAPFAGITTITFESMEAFQNSFGVNAEKIKADGPNYTNVVPVVQISKVILN